MSDTVLAASITACVTVAVALLTQFGAESYRRFKDGSAIAAGLAGELSSYEGSVPLIRVMLRTARDAIEAGNKDKILLRPGERPVDRYFDKVVDKVGLLGPDLTKEVIYVYNNLATFRTALALVSEKHADMTSHELLARLTLCSEAFERADAAGLKLVPALLARGQAKFLFRKSGWSNSPST